MVGRFISHDGKQKNTPAVRFGNIAMMPKERIVSPHGIAQESFLVETRSLPGYSGSAVFLYSPNAMNDMSLRRFGKNKAHIPDLFTSKTPGEFEDFTKVSLSPKGPYLLGVDWCHLNKFNRVLDANGEDTGNRVEENTGMAGVVPAWKIIDILDSEELVTMREEDEKTVREAASVVSEDYSRDREQKATKEFTQADFEAALRKVSRKVDPEK
jgi:hypothetical protein